MEVTKELMDSVGRLEVSVKLLLETTEKGGPGSGNFGHVGRPGQVGGSGSGSGKDNPEAKPETKPEVKPGLEGTKIVDYHKWAEDLGVKADTNQEESLADYERAAYMDVNSSLRGHGQVDSETDVKELVGDLDSLFAKAIPTKADVSVFRAWDYPEDMKVGDRFSDKGFASSSSEKSVAEDFVVGEKVVCEILVPKGSRVVPVSHILDLKDSSEKEVLLNRSSTYEVVSVAGDHVKLKLVNQKGFQSIDKSSKPGYKASKYVWAAGDMIPVK
jgi:hypothetical protein